MLSTNEGRRIWEGIGAGSGTLAGRTSARAKCFFAHCIPGPPLPPVPSNQGSLPTAKPKKQKGRNLPENRMSEEIGLIISKRNRTYQQRKILTCCSPVIEEFYRQALEIGMSCSYKEKTPLKAGRAPPPPSAHQRRTSRPNGSG